MATGTPTYDLTGSHVSTAGEFAQSAAASSGSAANAYLIVHADFSRTDSQGDRNGETTLQRLRALYRGGPRHDQRTPLALTLADCNGQELLSLADAVPTLGIALPPGTYHLSAIVGDIRRGYTVSLPAGARFDLHLRFALPDRLRLHAVTAASDLRPIRSSH